MRLINIDTPYVNAANNLRVTIRPDDLGTMNPRTDMDNLGRIVAEHRNYMLGDDDAKSELIEVLQSLTEHDIDEGMIDCPECNGEGESDVGKVICHECGGSCEIDNPHYVDTSCGRGLWEGMDAIDPNEEHIFRLPVYMYEHSGITLRTFPFSCEWDSGQLGFIWMTRKVAEAELGGTDGTLESVRTVAHRMLNVEIEMYDKYVSGEVYGFVVESLRPKPDDWEEDEWTEVDDHWEEVDSCWGFFGMDLIENGILEHLDEGATQAICDSEGISLERLTAEEEQWHKKAMAAITDQ